MPPQWIEFEAVIESGDGGGAYVTIDDTVHAALGGAGRVPVEARFDGHAYQGSVVRMCGVRMLGMTRALRTATDKDIGDRVAVRVRLDTAQRTVAVPDELAAVLEHSERARAFYTGLSYTGRKEYAQWVGAAKRPETRVRRAEKARRLLETGQKL